MSADDVVAFRAAGIDYEFDMGQRRARRTHVEKPAMSLTPPGFGWEPFDRLRVVRSHGVDGHDLVVFWEAGPDCPVSIIGPLEDSAEYLYRLVQP